MPPTSGRRMGADANFWGQILARDAALGRYQGPEMFDSRTVDLSAPTSVTLPPFNLKRPLESIELHLAMRATVTVGAYAAVSPEAPQNILQRVTLRGVHTKYGSQEPINMTGASAFVYPLHFQRTGGQCFTSVGGGAVTLAANPGVPFTSPFTGAVATHDIRLIWRIPLTPILGADQSVKRQLVNYLFYQRDWNDTLTLDLSFGDKSALGDPTGATVAFTAYGSATGLPTIQTHLNYALLGQFESLAVPGIVIRNEQALTAFTSTATQSQLVQLQRKITNAIIIKSGVRETTAQSAGVSTFESLSDLMLDRTQVLVDFKPVRRVDSNYVERAYINAMMNTSPLQGYYPITFVESQNPLTAFRGDDPAISSSTFAVYTDVLTADANNRINVIQEQVIGGMYPPIR